MDRKARQEYRDLFELSSMGIMFPVAIALGCGWGWLLDRWLGTGPVLMWIFAGFGVIAAFLNLFRMTSNAGRRIDEADRPRDDSP